ncbi:MAG: FtsX-like permease family protein [bacterium]
MRARKLLYIITTDLAEHKARTFSAIFVIAFTVGIVLLIAALGFGFLGGAMRRAEAAFPPGILVVKPRALNIAMLSISAGILDRKLADRVSGLPGVEYAAPQLSLRMPLRAEGEVMGQTAVTDAVVVGIGSAAVQSDVAPGYRFNFDPATSQPIPCVVPRLFLDMYNYAYADSMGLPKINSSYPIGKLFTLHLGESYLTGDLGNTDKKRMRLAMKVVGLSSNPALPGVTIPLGAAEEMNRWYTGRDKQLYNALHVKVRDLGKLDAATSSIQEMGLVVESQRDVLEKFVFLARAVALITSCFGLVIVAIAAVSVFNTFSLIMNQRRGEIGLLRAVGATRRFVMWLFIAEVGIVGLAGGCAGTLASWALAGWADRRLLAALPNVSFLPDHIFSAGPVLILSCVAGAMVLSILATLPVIMRTAGLTPASLVNES